MKNGTGFSIKLVAFYLNYESGQLTNLPLLLTTVTIIICVKKEGKIFFFLVQKSKNK